MSCWVVPTVAAEYWGITLDVVRQRMSDGLFPQKSEQGFVFIDVDPWSSDSNGKPFHSHPPTFAASPIDLDARNLDSTTGASCSAAKENNLPHAPSHAEIGERIDEQSKAVPRGADLPLLDDEESATFGRLSWQDVRRRVGRIRRPPSHV